MNAQIACCTVWHKITTLPFKCPQCGREFLRKEPEVELNDYADVIYRTCEAKGFTTPSSIDETELALAKLMLIVTEVSEAAEAVRRGDVENLCEELSDIIIRTLHLSRGLRYDIQLAVRKKLTVNEGREFRHGKRI
jgi:NTP pyrophosphatase (non-canonical NTP hydrolase)